MLYPTKLLITCLICLFCTWWIQYPALVNVGEYFTPNFCITVENHLSKEKSPFLHYNSKGPNVSQVARSRDYFPKYSLTVFIVDLRDFFSFKKCSYTYHICFASPIQALTQPIKGQHPCISDVRHISVLIGTLSFVQCPGLNLPHGINPIKSVIIPVEVLKKKKMLSITQTCKFKKKLHCFKE